ncbi:Putative LOC101896609, partial [Caligus rogercresseyi]
GFLGIDFIKNDDPIAAKHFQVFSAPALMSFRHGNPIAYDGELLDGEKDVFELKDYIEPVNRKLLDKYLMKMTCYSYFYTDNEGMRRDLNWTRKDITFVRINDPRYAKKYGVNRLPSLVYFRRRFPSIFR